MCACERVRGLVMPGFPSIWYLQSPSQDMICFVSHATMDALRVRVGVSGEDAESDAAVVAGAGDAPEHSQACTIRHSIA